MQRFLNPSLYLLLLCSSFLLKAQQSDFHWKIGIHAGLTDYYGDLNTQFLAYKPTSLAAWRNHLSLGLSLEKRLSRAWTIRLKAGQNLMQANDRAATDYFDRALNAQMNTLQLDGNLVFYTDNGSWLGRNAIVSPFFSIGAGFTHFSTYGDLWLGALGTQRYFYWTDGSIRSLDQNDPAAATAALLAQDGVFETNLQKQKTEGKSYPNISLHASLGLGLKFRLARRWNLQLEANLHYLNTDYLDDVSGNYLSSYNDAVQAYSANPSGRAGNTRGSAGSLNDMYASGTLSLHYSFGWVRKAFIAPIIFSESAEGDSLMAIAVAEKVDSVINTEKSPIENQLVLTKDSIRTIEKTSVRTDSVFIKTIYTNVLDSNYNALQMLLMRNELEELRRSLNQSSFERQQLQTELLKTAMDYERQLNEWRWNWLRNNLPAANNKDTLVFLGQGNINTKDSLEIILLQQVQSSSMELSKGNAVELDMEELRNLSKLLQEFKTNKPKDPLLEKALTQLQSQMDSLQTQIKKPDNTTINNNTLVFGEQRNDSLLLAELEMLRIQLRQIDSLPERQPDSLSTIPSVQNMPSIDYSPQLQALSFEIALLRKELLQQKSENRAKIEDPLTAQTDRFKILEQENERLRQNLQSLQASMAMLSDFNQVTNNKKTDSTETVALKKRFHVTQIYFAASAKTLDLQAIETLETLIDNIENYPNLHLNIKGFASKTGTAEQNKALSKMRAEIVQNYILSKKKIAPERLHLLYFGDTQSKGNELQDRRVELELFLEK